MNNPQITQKLIHEKFVFIHGHSCFKKNSPHSACEAPRRNAIRQIRSIRRFYFFVGQLSELNELIFS